MACCALRALAERFSVVAAVVPDRPLRTLGSLARRTLERSRLRPFLSLAADIGIPAVRHCTAGKTAERLTALRAELICVATFPRLLPADLLRVAPGGAVGLHPSLLPRHRGPTPLFWTYFHDDRQAGLTVHWLDAGEDSGDLIEQQALPLARGRPLDDLYAEMALRGGKLLVDAVGGIARGTASRTPQDASGASREGRPAPGAPTVDAARWPAERVWHVLGGLGARYGELVADGAGRPVHHGPAVSLTLGVPALPPGTIERHGAGWRVWCTDGVVDTIGPPLASRLRQLIRVGGPRRSSGR